MKRLAKFVSLALLLGTASVPYVQSAQTPMRGPIPFESFDRDGNGAISEQEFYSVRGERMAARAAQGRMLRRAAQAPSYEDIDLNGDKVISREEHAEHQATHCARRRP
ncbi:hypothetical protein [Solemya velum gill symbiont]|uniref:EF-hand domain-containing protein n=1 Tax=Solemya velum gill symbiont TaxID=2340 RepID=A0A0B0HC22_SOVGS|nr:hypothetical protein [Solemya velum gill symbiont]KHF24981.1 hypothetical protein JV46_08960 [Solemya velum gill symbiont]OOY34638.1 hypothetical protein BOV88_09310 [Solemya velum gill symbiont]OOY37432.1 hypothetical protein BOV89_07745 [Solemya velum gill symbiont]OOY40389.1 hypothetical protein BOV90_04260 [Solemya velum gill symbiont]OOY41867.1 hypothetical protein BOV91_09200 [Solemya velum gill symbiont]